MDSLRRIYDALRFYFYVHKFNMYTAQAVDTQLKTGKTSFSDAN